MRLDHLGIAVRSLEESLKFYRDRLGLPVEDIRTVPAEKVRVAMMPLAGSRIELLEATAADSPVARFIEKRGEGIHHIAITVSGLEERLQELEAAGVRVLPGKGEYGAGGHRYAFLHPSSCGGVLVELVEIANAPEAGAQ